MLQSNYDPENISQKIIDILLTTGYYKSINEILGYTAWLYAPLKEARCTLCKDQNVCSAAAFWAEGAQPPGGAQACKADAMRQYLRERGIPSAPDKKRTTDHGDFLEGRSCDGPDGGRFHLRGAQMEGTLDFFDAEQSDGKGRPA